MGDVNFKNRGELVFETLKQEILGSETGTRTAYQ